MNQSKRQAAVRALSGSSLDHNGDWHALFDEDGIAPGTFNERMLIWLNVQLDASHAGLPEAQAAYAEALGASSWSALDDIQRGPFA